MSKSPGTADAGLPSGTTGAISSIASCTIAGHRRGSGVQTNRGTNRIVNSIVWGNLGDSLVGTGSFDLAYSCIENEPLVEGVGLIRTDSEFVPNRFLLGPTSPCIDAGNNEEVERDLFDLDGDGNTEEAVPVDRSGWARFGDHPDMPDTGSGRGPIVDMSAYEYWPGRTASLWWLD